MDKATLFHNDISWQVNGFKPCGYETCYDFFLNLCASYVSAVSVSLKTLLA